jgi:copper transport protein
MKQARQRPTDTSPAKIQRRGRRARLLLASLLAFTLLLLFSGVASAHALLARSDPPQNAILNQAPTQVRLWFTEEVNPALSKAIVVDPTNHELDKHDSHISSADPKEIDLGLSQLGPGAYIVIWHTVSANDGHPAAGSFIFRVRFPDGSVPAAPGQLPSIPAGFGSASNSQCLVGDTPYLCLPLVFSDWIVFVMMALWVGGLCWQIFLVERAAREDRRLVPIASATARRFRTLSLWALTIFVLANLGYVMGQAILAGGSLASAFSATIWGGILLLSKFGLFWLLRQIFALVALLLVFLTPARPQSAPEQPAPTLASRARLLLALGLLVALAFSGHAAAAQQAGSIKAFAIPVDLLHLLSTAVWVGGLFFIALALFPAVWTLPGTTERAHALTKLLPRFSGIALASVTIAALSGSYNADVQLTSWGQFLDTAYGRTLIIKILLFCVMVAISAYHAYRLRPALSHELATWKRAQAAPKGNAAPAHNGNANTKPASATTSSAPRPRKQPRRALKPQNADTAAPVGGKAATLDAPASPAPTDEPERERQPMPAPAPAPIERLNERLRFWIRREATLGLGVLLCASLLGVLAGTLTPPTSSAAAPSAPTITATSKTPVDLTQTQNGLQVTFKVSPDTFGPNNFGVVLVDSATGQPIDGASVHLLSTMLDMDMGTQPYDLQAKGKGFYLGQGDLTMGGHWQVVVQVRVPSDPNTIRKFTFLFSASF